MKTIHIGLDIGGTKIAALATNSHQQKLAETVQPTPIGSATDFMQGVQHSIGQLLAQTGTDASQIAAIGAGIPGRINQQTGHVYQAVNLNLDNYPLQQMLQQQYGCPVAIENDVATAALGAFSHLQQTDSHIQHMAYLGLGTGVAAGLVLNGRLYRGSSGMAGEIGHVNVEPNGALCNCGAHGCLETIIAGPAIARQAAAFLSAPATLQDVYQAAQQNNFQAQALLQRIGTFLAQAIQWLIMAYDIEKIVLGGGVTSAGNAFMNTLLPALARLREQSPLAMEMLTNAKMTQLPATYNPGLWGAIYLAGQARLNPNPNFM